MSSQAKIKDAVVSSMQSVLQDAALKAADVAARGAAAIARDCVLAALNEWARGAVSADVKLDCDVLTVTTRIDLKKLKELKVTL